MTCDWNHLEPTDVEEIGSAVLSAISAGNLLRVEVIDPEPRLDGGQAGEQEASVAWTANAAEQIGTLIQRTYQRAQERRDAHRHATGGRAWALQAPGGALDRATVQPSPEGPWLVASLLRASTPSQLRLEMCPLGWRAVPVLVMPLDGGLGA
jgi:hypothetical protein